MNKFLRLVLLCAGLAGHCYAQTSDITREDDTMYWYNNKAVFEQMELARIPSGILMDYGIPFTNPAPFDGQSLDSSKEMDIVTFEQLNASLLSAQIGETSGLSFSPAMLTLLNIEQPIKAPLDPQVLYDRLHRDITYNHIRIAGLLYSYQEIDSARQHNLKAENGALYDTYDEEGNWQDPYRTKNVFAMALSANVLRSNKVTVEIPANLWQTNRNASPSSLSIDADDGLGWRSVSFGGSFEVDYPADGAKHWKFKLQLSDGSTWWGNGGPLVVHNATADDTLTITGTTPYMDEVTSAHISIDYAPGHTSLQKPLIIVEGFDPGDVLAPDRDYGLTDIQRDFEDGLSLILPTNELLTQINTNQYDLVYIDWDNGSDYLERNANLLKDIIKWVNDAKNNAEQSVLWGFSMGGVIGRYALKDLEDDGYNHQVRLFISHDAPQQGANVPYGAQAMAFHIKSMNLNYGQVLSMTPAGTLPLAGAASIGPLLDLANRPAAQQMLISQFNVTGQTLHYAWQEKLRQKGYPQLCRNIAVSNGAECGNGLDNSNTLFLSKAEAKVGYLAQMGISIAPYINFWIRLFGGDAFVPGINLPGVFNQSGLWTVVPGPNIYTADFKVNSNYENIGNTVYNGQLKYTKTIIWLIDVNAFNSHMTVGLAGVKAWDAFPGGVYPVPLGSGNIDLTGTGFKLKASYSGVDRISFVPTVSALDLGSNNNNTSSPVYYSVLTGTQPPASPNNTPFDNFITANVPGGSAAENNEVHTSITNRNAEFTGQEIGYNTTSSTNSCTNACADKQISGTAMICAGNYIVYDIPFAANGTDAVTWSISPTPSSPLVVNGNECRVNNTGAADAGDYILTATIHTVCGIAHYTKEIHLGYPDFWLAVTPVSNQGEVVSLGPDCVPGVGQVQWNVPYVSSQTQTYPISSYGWPCWFFNHVFTATSDTYPVTVNATVITPCGAKQLSLDYTYDGGNGGPSPNNPYASGNSGNGSDRDDPSGSYQPSGAGSHHMTISPNPSKKYWNLNTFGQSGTYSLSDITGKVILHKVPFQNNASVKARNLLKGMYLLQVQTSGGIKTFKLVKE